MVHLCPQIARISFRLQLKPQNTFHDPNALYSERSREVFAEPSCRSAERSGSVEPSHPQPYTPGHHVQVTFAAGSGPQKQQPSPKSVRPPSQPQPRGCRTHLPTPVPAPRPAPRPQPPARPARSPPYSPPGGSPLSPPETYRRSERPPANS